MKRALTFLVAVVCCWTVSFVQAANVELKFYSGVPGEYVSAAEDLHYVVKSVDGNTIAEETLDAEDKGKAEADIEAEDFYVVVEQPSTKFFGSVLVNKGADELFFILDASGLTWIENAHSCPDDAECMQDGAEGVCDCCDDKFVGEQHNGERYENGQCCDDDCCDADCICRKLAEYLAKRTENLNDVKEKDGTGEEPSTNTISRSPYSSGTSNFGTTGTGTSPYGAAGGLSNLGMLGMIGAVIAVAVTKNSTSPTSPSGTSVESK